MKVFMAYISESSAYSPESAAVLDLCRHGFQKAHADGSGIWWRVAPTRAARTVLVSPPFPCYFCRVSRRTCEMATFKIGINMAGAVSAGAYTAGVLDFLIEALDAW